MGADRNDMPFLFLDLETTGHDSLRRVGDALVPWHEIIEVGAVIADQASLREIDTFEARVHPEHPERCIVPIINDYPERSAQGDWDGAHSLDEVIRALLDWCRQVVPDSKALLAGQNFTFDWSFLTVAFAWCGVPEEEWSTCLHYSRLDTRSMAVQALWDPKEPYVPGHYSLRNDRLARILGVPPEPLPHEALNGARTSLAIFRKMQEMKRRRHAL